MPRLNGIYTGGELMKLIISELGKDREEEIKSGYFSSALEDIFKNAELLSTCFTLFENDLNVSLTARKLYMHRNTLIYRINKINKVSGLNICRFADAVTFLILYGIYERENVESGGNKK